MPKREAEDVTSSPSKGKKQKSTNDDDDKESSSTASDGTGVKALEAAYDKAKVAYKADKTNKDLKKAKSAAKKAWEAAAVDGEGKDKGEQPSSPKGDEVDKKEEDDDTSPEGKENTNEEAEESADEIVMGPFEVAYRNALAAFKADKTNKDLRRAKSAAKNAWDAHMAATIKGEQLMCRDCSQRFIFTPKERKFYKEKGWTHSPTRCRVCNDNHQTRLHDRSKRDDRDGKDMCYAFQRGECTRGEKCKFSHDPKHGGTAKEEGDKAEKKKKGVCFPFLRGECNWGDGCRYNHVAEDPSAKTTSTAEEPSSTTTSTAEEPSSTPEADKQ